jgi:hypothetical protein
MSLHRHGDRAKIGLVSYVLYKLHKFALIMRTRVLRLTFAGRPNLKLCVKSKACFRARMQWLCSDSVRVPRCAVANDASSVARSLKLSHIDHG